MKEQENNKSQQQSRAISNNLETTGENKGLSMMPPPLQFKSLKGEEEEGKKPIQKKSNPNGMPEKVQTKMENAFGQDFSNVNIHTNSNSAKDMGALAYAQGNDVHFASGQYNPESQKGQELLGHELTHVVQQREGRVKPTTQAKGVAVNDDKGLEKEADEMGRKVVQGKMDAKKKKKGSTSSRTVQGYFVENRKKQQWRQSDDLSIAVKDTYPNHELYAATGKADAANKKLAAVGSKVELVETGKSKTFYEGDPKKPVRSKVLNKIEPKHGGKQGDKMKIWADCGKSNAEVVGGSKRQSSSIGTSGSELNIKGSPVNMKMGVMSDWLNNKAKTATPSEKTKIAAIIKDLKSLAAERKVIADEYKAEKDDDKKKKIASKYQVKQYQISDKLASFYNDLPKAERDSIDKKLKINQYANPETGQGYTTVSSDFPGPSTWNYHWGGVVMESNSKEDKVVLENYSVGKPKVKNKKWDFQMYGTLKSGQTFHEQHKATNQHGKTPTTLTIEKE